jgi:two-component system response regulator AtoC
LKVASREASRRAEREMILKQLELTRWNRKRTARELQISYKALLYKLKQLGLDGPGNTDGQ